MIISNLNFNHPKYSDELLNQSISEILTTNTLLSLANFRKTDEIIENWICTAFYAFNSSIDLYILTPLDTQHATNLKYSKSVAVTIFDSHQKPTKPKCGIQLLGECELAQGRTLIEGYRLYGTRFIWLPDIIRQPEDFAKGIIQSKIFIIRPKMIKMLHEKNFGEENYITLNII